MYNAKFIFPSSSKSVTITREYFQQEDICRFCWSKEIGKKPNSKIISTLRNTLICKVENCLNIDLSQDSENYPKIVCETCSNTIEDFHNFKNFCQHSNKKLGEILNPSEKRAPDDEKQLIKLEKFEECTNVDIIKSESLDSFLDTLQQPESTSGPKLDVPSNQEQITNFTNILSEVSLQNILKSSTTITRLKTKQNLQNELEKHLESSSKKASQPIKKLRSKGKYKAKNCSSYCNICSILYKDQETFLNHKSEAHGIERDGKYSCFGCKKQFKSLAARTTHEVHSCQALNDGYKCSECKIYLPLRSTYELHMKDHRNNKVTDVIDELIFRCSKCAERFSKREQLKAHNKEVHEQKTDCICETCGHVFTHKKYLIKHMVVHTGLKRYKCSQCGHLTSQKQNLTIHMRKHTGERPYACDLCPQRCISNSNLLAHRRRHFPDHKSFQCSICDKKYGYKLSLIEHIKITHEQSACNLCPHCGAVYARKRGLKRHLQAKHGAPIVVGKKRTKIEKVDPNGVKIDMKVAKPSANSDNSDLVAAETFPKASDDSDKVKS